MADRSIIEISEADKANMAADAGLSAPIANLSAEGRQALTAFGRPTGLSAIHHPITLRYTRHA